MSDHCNRPTSASWRQHLHLLVAAALAPFLAGIYALSFWLRFEGQLGDHELACFRATVGWVLAVKLVWFVGLRACRGWRRSVAFYDLVVLLRAATGGLLTVAMVQYLLAPLPAIPRSVLLVDWGATIVVLGGARALLRGVRETPWRPFSSAGQVRVLIAGASDMGASTLRMIRRIGQPRYRVVGFIDDNPDLRGTRVEGVPVVGDCRHARQLVDHYRAGQVLVMQGELAGPQVRRLLDDARGRCDVRILPNYRQLLEGSVTVQPRPVTIEDLLQREPVRLDIEDIRHWIDGRVILVTGSAGSIGSEICRQLLAFDPQRIVLVDRAETGQFFLERELQALAGGGNKIEVCVADVLDGPHMRRILMRHRPHVIFHAAAYKHVPLMERHPQEAVKNIVAATRRMADLAVEFHTDSFVLISTDKAVNPTSVMGACKRVAELYVQSLAGRAAGRFITVRFGNVLDSAGSVVPLFRQQIAAGGPVTVTHPDVRRYFMTIPEAARLVLQAGAIGQSGQVLVLDMGEPVRIVDLASDMIRLSGLRVGEDVALEFTGLRPGEKLYEELHIPGEQRLPTSHPKIIVANHKPPPVSDVGGAVAELERLADVAPEEIVGQLQQIVCGYEPGGQRDAAKYRAAA